MAVLTTGVIADPSAPSSLVEGSASTFNPANYALQTVEASAGNITGLVLEGISQTRAWQGYYGNISGTITLDDANNYTFYNWESSEPRGQIYATLDLSIGWTGVQCFNFTNVSSANMSVMEAYYGIASDDYDGVNETFNNTDHQAFQVGSRTMTGCPTTYVFQDDVSQVQNFTDVLLFDPLLNDTGWIYTTLIETKAPNTHAKATCYNGDQCDFQLLVNDDGHGTDTATTTYYFWVELI
jgi:hypothetical protein